MSTTILARANKYDIDKLLDFEESLPNPKHCMSLITDAMHKYNKLVKEYHSTPRERIGWIPAIIEWGLGNDIEDKDLYPNKVYTSECQFCKDFDSGFINFDEPRDLLELYYRTQDLFKVVKIANCAKMGDRVVLCGEYELKALKRVVNSPDIYINLYEDNDYCFD